MEVVVAADSDERGLTLLRLWNALRNFVLEYWSVFFSGDSATTKSKSSSAPATVDDNNQRIESSVTTTAQEEETQQKTIIKDEQQDHFVVVKDSSVSDIDTETATSKMPARSEEEIAKKIHELCEVLILNDETLHEVCASLNKELDRGLSRETNKEAAIKCFPTYVQELPNGKECGRFLALDLGGTNFRVLLIELGESQFKMDSKIYAVPHDIMIGPGTGLFDHIAECLASFISERSMEDELLPLGFTFSFPCAQEGLTKARLACWTKGFKCPGVEGNDVVGLLQEAIVRRGDVRIKICAVLNDTTGTLMSCAWKNRNCRIGLIVGTGTNACYMEKLDKVELWEGANDGPQQVVVNTEWGAFGDNGCLENIRVQYDHNIDNESINPGRQIFEKMISGMYMGEIARQVLVHLVEEQLLFPGQPCEALKEKGQFFTKYISEIEGDTPGDFSNCQSVLEDLGIEDATDAELAHVRYVCECISRRAAYLAGSGVAVLLNRINEQKVTVAVDGSVYKFHPFFHSLMVEVIQKLVTPGTDFELMLSEDGSGRGAALVAAVANRSENEKLMEKQQQEQQSSQEAR